jgi:hypothetical protein
MGTKLNFDTIFLYINNFLVSSSGSKYDANTSVQAIFVKNDYWL